MKCSKTIGRRRKNVNNLIEMTKKNQVFADEKINVSEYLKLVSVDDEYVRQKLHFDHLQKQEMTILSEQIQQGLQQATYKGKKSVKMFGNLKAKYDEMKFQSSDNEDTGRSKETTQSIRQQGGIITQNVVKTLDILNSADRFSELTNIQNQNRIIRNLSSLEQLFNEAKKEENKENFNYEDLRNDRSAFSEKLSRVPNIDRINQQRIKMKMPPIDIEEYTERQIIKEEQEEHPQSQDKPRNAMKDKFMKNMPQEARKRPMTIFRK